MVIYSFTIDAELLDAFRQDGRVVLGRLSAYRVRIVLNSCSIDMRAHLFETQDLSVIFTHYVPKSKKLYFGSITSSITNGKIAALSTENKEK